MNECQELLDQCVDSIRHLSTRLGGSGLEPGMYLRSSMEALAEDNEDDVEHTLKLMKECYIRAHFILEALNTVTLKLEEKKSNGN